MLKTIASIMVILSVHYHSYGQVTATLHLENQWYKGFHSWVNIVPNGATYRTWEIIVPSQINLSNSTIEFTDAGQFPKITVTKSGNNIIIYATDFGVNQIANIHFNVKDGDLPTSNPYSACFPSVPPLAVQNLETSTNGIEVPEGYNPTGSTVNETVIVRDGKLSIGTVAASDNTLTVGGGALFYTEDTSKVSSAFSAMSDYGTALRFSTENGKLIEAHSDSNLEEIGVITGDGDANGLRIETKGSYSLKVSNNAGSSILANTETGTGVEINVGQNGKGLVSKAIEGDAVIAETETGNAITARVTNNMVNNFSGVFLGSRFKINGDINEVSQPGLYVSKNNLVGIGTDHPTVACHINGTDAIVIPVGNTSERPEYGTSGMLRYNTDLDELEYYNGNIDGWNSLNNIAGTTGERLNAGVLTNDDSTCRVQISDATTGGSTIFTNGNAQTMIINNVGQVGIGTDFFPHDEDVTFKLAVNGGIAATMVKVKTSEQWGWPDYVFADNYKLKDLTEVKSFIADNKHLPDVPSATHIEKEGINLGQMDAILMMKIEELTLYIIEQQNEINALKEANKQILNRLK